MKILKSGNKFWHLNIFCINENNNQCNAELEILIGDIFAVYSYELENNLIKEYAIRCPECREEIIINQQLIPEEKLSLIPDKINHFEWTQDKNNGSIQDSMK